MNRSFDLAILGAGPGGYSAAIRASQLGLKVALVDPRAPGGVCLHEGCIPSKALLHAAGLWHRARQEGPRMGLHFAEGRLDIPQLQAWKEGVVTRLSTGVQGLLRKHGVEVFPVKGRLVNATLLELLDEKDKPVDRIGFQSLILATGSREAALPALRGASTWGAREALSFAEVPKRLAVVGAGIIGLELGQLFSRLGSEVHLFEALPELLPGRDRAMVRALKQALEAEGLVFHLGSRVNGLSGKTLEFLEGGQARRQEFDRVLTCVGRRPNSEGLGLEPINIAMDERGFLQVNVWLQTALPHIYAIGDLVAGPLLAHRAARMGLLAAENATGRRYPWDIRGLPAVLYTDPELAWVGISAAEAQGRGLSVKNGSFPLAASGRALTENAGVGGIQLTCESADGRLVGAEALGHGAEGLIASAALAIELGSSAEDIALSVQPHPSIFEALVEAAESVDHMAIHLFQDGGRKK